MMKPEILVLSITAVVVIISITIPIVGTVRRRRQRKDREGESLSQTKTIPAGSTGEQFFEDIPYRYKHFRGTDKAAPFFSITFPCASTGAFTITRESKFDRFFKNLGISVEIQTYDPTFDDAFYINTAAIPFTRLALEKTGNRKSIQALFDLGFNHLKHDGKTITLTWKNFPRKKSMEVETMEKAAAQLTVLVRSLPNITTYETPEPTTWKCKRRLAFALPILLLVTGIITLIIGTTSFKPLDLGRVFVHSLMFSLPLWVLYTWFSLRLLKGRSSSHREFIAVFFIAIAGFPLAGFGFDTYLNGALDHQPPAVHQVMVLNKYYTKHKNSYSYYAVTQSWRENDLEEFSLSRSFYDNLKPGSSMMTITTRPGKFGFEWIVEIH